MLRLFSISAAIPDGKLHELMLYMEEIGCGNINARPIPVEVSEMMVRMNSGASMGVPPMVPAPARKAVAAPAAPQERPKPNGGRGKARASRHTPEMRAMRDASLKFLTVGREFETGEFKAMLQEANPAYVQAPTSRLIYYVEKGVLERLDAKRWRVVKPWEPANL